jgi:hypothetical protein
VTDAADAVPDDGGATGPADAVGQVAGAAAVRAASAALTALSLAPITAYLWAVSRRAGYPYELEWMEGGAVELVRRVARGEALYAAPTLEHTPWSYPPLHPVLSSVLTAPWGHSLPAVRGVSVASSVVAIAAVGVIVHRATGRVVAGVVAAGAFAGSYQLSGAWFDIARVDSLMLALLLLGVAVGQRARTVGAGVRCGVLLVAALATKQTAVVVVAVVVAWLVWRRRPAGMAAAATVIGLGGAGWLWSDRVSDGWFTEFVVRILPAHEIITDRVLSFWTADVLVPFLPTVAVAGCAVLVGRARLVTVGRTDSSSYVVASCGALVFSAWPGRFHTGGAGNVLMPAHAALAILLGCAVALLLAGTQPSWRIVAVLGVAAQLALVVGPPQAVVPPAGDQFAGTAVIAALRALPGRVVLVDHPHYLTLAGQEPVSHIVALTDVQRSAPGGRARVALAANLDNGLDDVSVIVLDRPGDLGLLGPTAQRDFVPLPTLPDSPPRFSPVGGLQGQPRAVLVRRGVSVAGLDLSMLGVATR